MVQPARVPHAQILQIQGPAGPIEALLEEPGTGTAALAAFGVICHPHPLHGGTLNNKVVHTLARSLHDVGLPTVRFNFRGVGASAGSYDHGSGETQDALAVVAWARTRFNGAASWLLGFSFGAIVAIRAAALGDARLLVTVAPAIVRREASDQGFALSPAVRKIVAGTLLPRCPWLIVQGDADELIDAQAVVQWATRLVPPPSVRVLTGASHFFHGRLPELRAVVSEFAQARNSSDSGSA